jgi:hypothetical protein
MRSAVWLAGCLFFCAAHAAAPTGAIDGVVRSGGAAIANAPIQAKDDASSAAFRIFSGPDGRFALEALPPGRYTLSVRMPGFKFLPFARALEVTDAAPRQHVDVELAIGNLDTLGDDPYTFLIEARDAAAALTGPAPRTADGRPDFSGVWFGKDDFFPEDPALLPWAAQRLQQRFAGDLQDLPRGQCLPAGVLPVGPFFRKFVQTPKLLVALNEDDVLGFRQIFLDGRTHPADPVPNWQGHSVGRWEGDTLVVDSVGFNDLSVMGVYPHTEQLHVVERYRRRDFGHMDVEIVVEDAGTLERPWTLRMEWDLAPDQELIEFVCGESILNMHLEWRTDFHELREQILGANARRR